MKNTVKKIIALITLIATFSTSLLTGCTPTAATEDPHKDATLWEPKEENKEPDSNVTEDTPVKVGVFDESNMIHQDGELLKTAAGDTVYLRGVNVSSFVTENWMLKIVKETVAEDGTTSRTYDRLITETWLERFGLEKTKALWEEYRRNYFSDTDFQLLKDMGVNCIRLPITYMTVDLESVYDYNLAAYEYDFSAVDAFIEKAASYGIYTMLDLHGAYGSQNGADHSGEFKDPTEIDFYYNEEMMQLTVDLWRAMAEHYKGNPAIAAYDILNEPAEHKVGGGTLTTTTRHWDFFDRIYDAIREVDTDHVVVFESCWGANNLPMPETYGWENCMYSFHHYTNKYGTDPTAHNNSMTSKINEIKNKNFGVPLHMGEFTCYDNKEQWEFTLNAFNENGIHWNNWTYKLHRHDERMRFWGFVNVTADYDQIDIYNDSYEEIFAALSLLKTGEGTTTIPTFSDGTSFHDVIKKYTK